MSQQKLKIILAKLGLDGHTRGIKLIAHALRDAGMEVVYLGEWQTPEKVVASAVQEDADIIGLSFLSGEQMIYTPVLMKLLKEKAINIPVIAGGTIHSFEIPKLKDMGVSEIFQSNATLEEITQRIKELGEKRNKKD